MLRTRDAVKPIYVSQGHRVSLQRAVERASPGGIGWLSHPAVIREADHFVERIEREVQERRAEPARKASAATS